MLKFEDNYPLNKITTLQIGGPARKFVKVKTDEELIKAIKYAKDQLMPYLIIGGGSNLLVSDEGFDGLVIKNEITGSISTSKVGFDSFEVSTKSGTPLQDLVDYTIAHGLSGLQKLTGIPGTIGGAVYGNAGAYGQTISGHLSNIVILACPESDSGCASLTRMTLSKRDCNFNYRDSIFKKTHDIILEVIFQLELGDPKILQQETQDILAKRLVKYPPGIKCPGSFFKNIIATSLPQEILQKIPPEKIIYGKLPAAALLEQVGAKGQKLDGIEIATYHANLFINKGHGSAKAFYNLAKKYAKKVKEKFGITLEPEVQLINLPTLI
ncbi:MAG: UDP-N-acetylmuramate dehydrogenase [Candidatus Daviesbacteria bacterium]|nr:UDP-N-acetylmuramate dehydrogenase [Candidatus Daviesbacteria bacterium]